MARDLASHSEILMVNHLPLKFVYNVNRELKFWLRERSQKTTGRVQTTGEPGGSQPPLMRHELCLFFCIVRIMDHV